MKKEQELREEIKQREDELKKKLAASKLREEQLQKEIDLAKEKVKQNELQEELRAKAEESAESLRKERAASTVAKEQLEAQLEAAKTSEGSPDEFFGAIIEEENAFVYDPNDPALDPANPRCVLKFLRNLISLQNVHLSPIGQQIAIKNKNWSTIDLWQT